MSKTKIHNTSVNHVVCNFYPRAHNEHQDILIRSPELNPFFFEPILTDLLLLPDYISDLKKKNQKYQIWRQKVNQQ